MADSSIQDAIGKEWDLIALPGGMPGECNIFHHVQQMQKLYILELTKSMVA